MNEYNAAFSAPKENIVVPTCEKICVNCGVCKNFKTHKVLAKPYRASEAAQNLKIEHIDPKVCRGYDSELFRYRIKLTKTGILKYFSHLDWQNTFLKALARTDLNIAFSLGFNPTMKVSMGVALPLFAESTTELIDVELYDNVLPEELKLKLEKVLPQGAEIISIVKIDKSAKSIDTTVQWAEYKISPYNKHLYDFNNLKYDTDKVLSSEEIFIEKKNKKGLLNKINIKPSIKSYRFEDEFLYLELFIPWRDFGLAEAPAEHTVWQGTVNRIIPVPGTSQQALQSLLDFEGKNVIPRFHQPDLFAKFTWIKTEKPQNR